ncbi:MAG: NUDIX domain-containing protein [Spirochaetales bacterium]|nr:NUDIX domain-containing protein [Spirochaetales bacterium]
MLNATRLNIRVTVLLATPSGYVFEKDKNGFYFPIGGRVKLNEASINTAIREVREEVDLKLAISDLTLTGLFEDFFRYDGTPFHEINLIYRVSVDHNVTLKDGFHCFPESRIDDEDIRPREIKGFYNQDSTPDPLPFSHHIIRDKSLY